VPLLRQKGATEKFSFGACEGRIQERLFQVQLVVFMQVKRQRMQCLFQFPLRSHCCNRRWQRMPNFESFDVYETRSSTNLSVNRRLRKILENPCLIVRLLRAIGSSPERIVMLSKVDANKSLTLRSSKALV